MIQELEQDGMQRSSSESYEIVIIHMDEGETTTSPCAEGDSDEKA